MGQDSLNHGAQAVIETTSFGFELEQAVFSQRSVLFTQVTHKVYDGNVS